MSSFGDRQAVTRRTGDETKSHRLRRPNGYIAKMDHRTDTDRGSPREGDPSTPGGAKEWQSWKRDRSMVRKRNALL